MFGSTMQKGWIMVIALALYRAMTVQNNTSTEEPGITDGWQYFAGVGAYTTLLTLLPLVTDTYGDAGMWCWVKASDLGMVWRFVSYGAVWIILIVVVWLYYWVARRVLDVMEGADEAQRTVVWSVLRRLVAYPVILFVGYSCGTVLRVHMAIVGTPSAAMYGLAIVTLNTHGFFNALAYGCTDSLLRAYSTCCCASDEEALLGDEELASRSVDDTSPKAVIVHADTTNDLGQEGKLMVEICITPRAQVTLTAESETSPLTAAAAL